MQRLKGLFRARPARCTTNKLVTCSMSTTISNGALRRSQRVAVIGAGAAGLVTARELRSEGHHVTVLEQSANVGGVWRYDPRIEAEDPLGTDPSSPPASRVHSSMYVKLRTNLPREVMSYSDFPFDSAFLGPRYSNDPRRFCSHQEVLGYLEAFADCFDLRPLVRTGTRVLTVQLAAEEAAERGPVPPGGTGADAGAAAGSWLVVSERLACRDGAVNGASSNGDGGGNISSSSSSGRSSSDGNAVQKELYDAVVVCNGHYSEPRLPDVRGMLGPTRGSPAAFPGQQLHSHNYRAPEQWRDKVVLVVGASNSGEDISRELSEAGARRVLLAARSWKNEAWGADPAPYGPGGNIYRFPMVEELHSDGSATFEGGRREGPIDAVIYCTGYKYTFPFLRGAAAAAAAVDDNCVGAPLWLHLLPPGGPLAPGLSFIGLPWKVVPFPQMELQAKLVARLLSGRVALPSQQQMLADIAAHFEAMRKHEYPKRYTHMQGSEQFAYNDLLASMCGGDVSPLPAWREKLYNATSALKRARPEDYRDGDLAAAAGGDTAAAIAAAEADIAEQIERLTGGHAGKLTAVLERRSTAGASA